MKKHLQEGTCVYERYRISRLLGEGGMGAVYLCEDLELTGKVWALKEMTLAHSPSVFEEQAIGQFKREVEILATLNHPNLPQISHHFLFEDKYYLVMEYIEGLNLAQVIEERGHPPKEFEVVAWAIQICDVLDYLHTQKPNPIIYRDLKPSNIMLTTHGQIKLIDFGIARFFDPCKVTDTFKMGSVGFSPPEQYRGKGTTDARSDIYSLGATLHFLLTGRDPQDEPPFSFPPPRTINPGLSPKIDRITLKALEYKRENRYNTVAEMKHALEEEEGLIWNNPVTKRLITTPLAARLLENPAAHRDKVALLVVLLFILGAALLIDAVKIYTVTMSNAEKRLAFTHYVRAHNLQDLGHDEEALQEYDRALKKDPDDIHARFCVGLIQKKLTHYGEAERAFLKVIKTDRKCSPAFRELGHIYYLQGRLGESEKNLRLSLEIEPVDLQSHYYLGLVLEKQDREEEALKEYERFVKIFPEAPENKDILERIRRLTEEKGEKP